MISAQIPLEHYKFNQKTTSRKVMQGVDLSGKTAVVTGGYSGIGLETVKGLLKAGIAQVIVPARRVEVAQKALRKLGDHVLVLACDLQNPESIHKFAEEVHKRLQKLDLLIHSAGIMYMPLKRVANGVESHMQTNHFGHFQLTAELSDLLTPESRIVNVSSRAQADADFNFDADWNWQNEANYTPKKGYDRSKAANVLFTMGLAKHGYQAFAVHPGAIPTTNIGRHVFQAPQSLTHFADKLQLIRAYDFVTGLTVGFDAEKGFATGRYRYLKSSAQGAATVLWAATSPDLAGKSGLYLEDCNIAKQNTATDSRLFGVFSWANDEKLAEKLWEFSEKLTGQTIPSH